jgi:hypothetical protein
VTAVLVGGLLAAVFSAIGLLATALFRLDAKFEGRFDRIDAKFDAVDARFDRVDARFDRMDTRFDRLEERLATHVH